MDRVLTTNINDQGQLYITHSSNQPSNNFQGLGLHAGEWQWGGLHVDALLECMAVAFNSNEQFEMDDSFQLSIAQGTSPQQEEESPETQIWPSTPTDTFKLVKQGVIRVNNEDHLYCAGAQVTTKAKVDNFLNGVLFNMKVIQKEPAL